MMVDVLILNSGEWLLAEELPTQPWHVLIYRQRGEPRNELHLWLPRDGAPRSGDYAFRRFWSDGDRRWCVEVPPDPDRLRGSHFAGSGTTQIRFTAPDGSVRWSDHRGGRRLADFTDDELNRLCREGRVGPFSRI
jgi:hypothetical protein